MHKTLIVLITFFCIIALSVESTVTLFIPLIYSGVPVVWFVTGLSLGGLLVTAWGFIIYVYVKEMFS